MEQESTPTQINWDGNEPSRLSVLPVLEGIAAKVKYLKTLLFLVVKLP